MTRCSSSPSPLKPKVESWSRLFKSVAFEVAVEHRLFSTWQAYRQLTTRTVTLSDSLYRFSIHSMPIIADSDPPSLQVDPTVDSGCTRIQCILNQLFQHVRQRDNVDGGPQVRDDRLWQGSQGALGHVDLGKASICMSDRVSDAKGSRKRVLQRSTAVAI